MKKVYLILALLFATVSIIFTVLPMGTLAFMPIIPAIAFAILAMRNSDGRILHGSRLILFVSASMLLIVIGKELFVKDEVVADKQFEQKKVESEKEATNELESEGL
ncbi:MAG: hypothetical protein EOO48_13215 [Flavobacterium sp.]|nr:MAG: hypothetical protein EOO48_13215 [Flavobacterium sp.]